MDLLNTLSFSGQCSCILGNRRRERKEPADNFLAFGALWAGCHVDTKLCSCAQVHMNVGVSC